jgi:hypothetical protein
MSRRKINGTNITRIGKQCNHEGFHVDAVVHRITEKKDGPVVGRCLVLQLSCDLCGQQFAFKGLPVEKTHLEPSMTSTGFEARLPIEPSMGERVATEVPGKDGSVI